MVHPAGFEPAGLRHVRAALSRLSYGCKKHVDHSGVEPDPHPYKRRMRTATPVVRCWFMSRPRIALGGGRKVRGSNSQTPKGLRLSRTVQYLFLPTFRGR